MKTLKIFFFFLLASLSEVGYAQDPVFTQTLGTPMYTNPAYAGIQQNIRAAFQIRDEWPGIGSGYLSYMASVELGLPKIKSGVGIMFMNTTSGFGELNMSDINAIYAYQIKINEDITLRMGINASVFQKVYQKNDSFGSVYGSPVQTTVFTPNFGVGFLLSAGHYYGGFSVMNLFEPIQSFNGDPQETLLRRYALQAGNFTEVGTTLINPNILITTQGTVSRFTPGVNFLLGPFVLGGSLRLSSQDEDAFNFLFGVHLGKLKICYSYDLNISANLGAVGGSHEVSLVYQPDTPHDTKDNNLIRHLRATF